MAQGKKIDYKFEEERIKSFANWPTHYPVDSIRLAKSGFYYVGNEDEVICFSCNGHLKNWNYGDVVQKKHSDEFPECDFVNNKSNNVPMKHKINPEVVQRAKKLVDKPIQSYKLLQLVKTINYDRMKCLKERLKTFSNKWPLSQTDAVKMAQAGFFYLGFEDKVQCAFCQGMLYNWNSDDVPLKEHKKHFPNCSISIENTMKIYKPLSWFEKGSKDVCGNHEMHTEYEPSKCRLIEDSQENIHLKKLGVRLHNGPAHPQQATLSARLRSFLSWHDSFVSKQNLATAGFFYIGINDQTKCFHCNGGLCGWEKDDDPWVEHAKWFPNCDFLRSSKGEDFIMSCLQNHESFENQVKNKECTSPLSPSNSMMLKVDQAMEAGIVQELLETKLFPVYIVRAAILRQIKETGASFTLFDDLCQAILFLKEEMEKESELMNNSQPNKLDVQDIDLTKWTIQNNDPDDEQQAPIKQPSAVKGTSKNETKFTKQENTFSNNPCFCKICWDKEVGVVFLPCGHLLSCTECAVALKDCPMCRNVIQATVRAYLP